MSKTVLQYQSSVSVLLGYETSIVGDTLKDIWLWEVFWFKNCSGTW